MRDWVLLPALARFDDLGLLILRFATGVFIIDGVMDNVLSRERMAEFIGFLTAGVLVLLGLATRWGGLILFATFTVGLVMVHLHQSLREWWPALALVGIGALLATRGGGRYALDRFVGSRG
jgi:putative oxidoreductase